MLKSKPESVPVKFEKRIDGDNLDFHSLTLKRDSRTFFTGQIGFSVARHSRDPSNGSWHHTCLFYFSYCSNRHIPKRVHVYLERVMSVAITQHRNRGLHYELLANTQSGQIKSEVLRCDDELYVRYVRTTYQLPETESPSVR
jgi:hypothetical protein